MFGKLIKHEFRATGRIMLPVLGAVLALAALSGVGSTLLDEDMVHGLIKLVFILAEVAFFLSLFAIFVVAAVLMIQRFYKNLMGDEGYLSMTLPVSADSHIWAKLIVSYVWFLAVCLLGVAAVITAMTFMETDFLSVVWSGLQRLVDEIGGGNVLLLTADGFALSLLLVFNLCLRFYCSMAIGCSAANKKGLYSVLSYFGLGILLRALQGTVLKVGIFDLLRNAGQGADSLQSILAGAHGGMLLFAVVLLAQCALLYLVTRFFLRRELNLG